MFAVGGIRHAIHGLLVTFQGLDQFAFGRVKDQDPVAHGQHELRPVRFERDAPDRRACAVPIRHLVPPTDCGVDHGRR